MNKEINFLIIILATIALCKVDGVKSQILQANDLRTSFESHVTNVHQEKSFVHTDRSIYVTGETIWLSTYTVDATYNTISTLSKVINIEIIGSGGQVMKQTRIKLVEGKGKGQLFISPEIPTGTYEIRAYTNWMKNFGSDFVFHKNITIVNPAVTPNYPSDTTNKILVEFFPEGGDLVDGVKSKVAIKTIDSHGLPVETIGVIVDGQDNEINKFKTSATGVTTFEFTPEHGQNYKALIAKDSIIKGYTLPIAQKEGVVLSVVSTSNTHFDININPSKNFNKTGYLLIHSKGIIERIQTIGLNNQLNLSIDSKKLQDGISHITILDNEMQPLAERLIFKYPIQPLSLKTEMSGVNFAKREKVSLTINSQNDDKDDMMEKMSISVSEINQGHHFKDHIESYLLLSSDIKGRIFNAPMYFDQNNKDRVQQMDLLMLTQGWRRFSWPSLKSTSVQKFKYPAEINAPILSGRLLPSQETGMLPKKVQLNFLGKSSIMNSLDIDPDGLFHFEVPFRVENETVNLFSTSEKLSKEQILIDDPFDLPYHRTPIPQLKFTKKSKPYLEKLNTNIQISQVYRSQSAINGNEFAKETLNNHFYGEPEHLYLLDNYTRFETVKDLFIEFIRPVQVKSKKDKEGFYIISNNVYLSQKAMTLIDGVPVLDAADILDFDPLKIEKIGVVNKIYHLGGTNYYGIINFTTYNGDFDGQELPDHIVEKLYKALQSPRTFYSPKYDINDRSLKRIPDFRNTLYWNPNVQINNSGKAAIEFYTSDNIGSYQIEINALSKNGRPLQHKIKFNVEDRMP